MSKLPILILIPVSQNPFYVYQSKHDFLEIHNGRGKFWPSKGATKDSSRFASSPRLKLSVQKRMSYLLQTDWHASLAFFSHVCSHGCHVGCLWRQDHLLAQRGQWLCRRATTFILPIKIVLKLQIIA